VIEPSRLPAATAGRSLRFEPTVDAAPARGIDTDRVRVVVADTAWTPRPGDPRETIRDAAEAVLAHRDLYDEATTLLEDWVRRAGIVDLLTIEGTSFWYKVLLGHWWWLQERLLWLGMIRTIVESERPARIEVAPGVDQPAIDVLRLVAQAEGLELAVEATPEEPDASPVPVPLPRDLLAMVEAHIPRRWPFGRVRGFVSRRRKRREQRRRREERERRQREREELARRRQIHAERVEAMLGRADRMAGQRVLLVLEDHARQKVETHAGTREINPYLDPILDELAGTNLRHLLVDGRARVDDESAWLRVNDQANAQVILGGALTGFDRPGEWDATAAEAARVADSIASLATPLIHEGIDFGPSLVARIADNTRRAFATRLREVNRIRRLMATARPAGLMLANEYNRQEWLAAARAEGVPVVAVQHGGIQRRHLGYIHSDRPAALTLPQRTYVFGQWERRLLTESSVYREDEVRVSGSPRLDLVEPEIRRERDKVRSELRVAKRFRMLVVSTTWAQLLRRYHFPVTLARLFDRPMPGVHVVIKLHPGEPDDDLYRRVIEGVAAARGFAPPPISIVQRVDLYRLLAAADAHLGIYSTVITEAVVTGTRNLLAACVQPNDLLGYVAAGVAVPVRDGGDLLAALESGAGDASLETRQAFVRDHFEPVNASRLIRDDLLEWLPESPESPPLGATTPPSSDSRDGASA
jgi:hypothetical protein